MNRNTDIPAMTPVKVHHYLEWLGGRWTGQGVAMELGCWLGASSVALLRGLVKVGYNRPYYVFDRWTANKEQCDWAKRFGVTLSVGQELYPLFYRNVRQVYSGNLIAVVGELPETLNRYPGDKIEICLFDAPKQEPVFTGCIQALYKHWIPGVTVIGLLDYNFYKFNYGRRRDVRFSVM